IERSKAVDSVSSCPVIINLGDFVAVFISKNKLESMAKTDVSSSFVKALRRRFMDYLKQNPLPESQWDALLECCFNMEKLTTPLNFTEKPVNVNETSSTSSNCAPSEPVKE